MAPKKPAPAPASRVPLYAFLVAALAALAAYLFPIFTGTASIPVILQKIRPANLLCERTNSPTFTEDAKLDYLRGIAFFTADANRGEYNTVMGRWNMTAGQYEKGDLWYFDPMRDVDVRPLRPDGFDLEGNDFHPLGIGLHLFGSGPYYLYMINHRRFGGTVELFSLTYTMDDLENTVPSLQWIRTIKSDVVNTPNSVLPLPMTKDGKLQYYVTNDHYFHTPGTYSKLKLL